MRCASSGEVRRVAKITRDDLADFYRRHYVAQHAVVAMIGDLIARGGGGHRGAGDARACRAARRGAARCRRCRTLAAGASRVIAHPASQSHILIGAPGITRDDPDYFPLFVGNYVLGGGGFVSRITEEVRQKRGLAYSAYSYFSPLRQRGPFLIGMQTQREQAQEALKVVRETLRDFVARGPDGGRADGGQAEHHRRFSAAHRQQPQDPRVPRADRRLPAAAHLSRRFREERRAGDGRREVKRAFARRIDPERMVTVVVGAAAEDAK